MRTTPPQHTPAPPEPDFELPPDTRPRWFLFGLVLIAAIGTAAYVWSRLDQRHELVTDAIPKPEGAALARHPGVLRARLSEAEQTARTAHGQTAIDALAALAHLYHANAFFEEASHIYSALIRLEPKNPRWPCLRATILANRGQLDEALPLFETAHKLDPNRVPLCLQLADALSKAGQTARASTLYNSVIAGDPGNPHALLGLARLDIAAQNWNAARPRLELAAALHPGTADPWTLLATIHEKLGQPDATQTDLARAKKSRALPPPPDDWTDSFANDCYDANQVRAAADTARSKGDRARARALLDHALGFAPGDAATHRQLGTLLSDLGSRAEAREHLRRAAELAPTDADAWTSLLALDNNTGNTTGALDNALLALAHCPQSGGLRHEYARALKTSGNLRGALFQFQEARRLRPEDRAVTSLEIALIHFRLNQPGEGERELRATLEADPGQPVALTAMARLAIGKNDAADAAAWLARAAAEPRVTRGDIDQLRTLYRKQFGQK